MGLNHHPRADLRVHDGKWVALDLDNPAIVWTWPLWQGAWKLRTAYDGPPFATLPKRHAMDAWSTEWPGARPIPNRFAVARPVTVQAMITTDNHAWLNEQHTRTGKSISLIIAELIDSAMHADRAGASSAVAPDDESRGTQPH